MHALLRAVESFFSHLADIAWAPLALAVLCHLAKAAARARSWRNVVAAAYPAASVPYRAVLGAYLAGVGVNAVLPARGGDLLRLYLVRRRVGGATYPTLAATLLVEGIFDAVVASALVLWALSTGALPGLDVIPRLPAIDWLWLFQHPRAAAAVTAVAVVLAFAAGIWAAGHITAFRRRVAQGFRVLHTPLAYLRLVVAWQALDWAFRLATVYFFLRAFGIPADVENVLLVQVSQSLSTVLPLTPAGIGTEQALLAYVLRGEAATSALLSFSVGMRLVLVGVNVAVGFAAIALMLRTLRWRDAIVGEAEAVRARDR